MDSSSSSSSSSINENDNNGEQLGLAQNMHSHHGHKTIQGSSSTIDLDRMAIVDETAAVEGNDGIQQEQTAEMHNSDDEKSLQQQQTQQQQQYAGHDVELQEVEGEKMMKNEGHVIDVPLHDDSNGEDEDDADDNDDQEGSSSAPEDEESGAPMETIGAKRGALPMIYLEFRDIEYAVRIKKGRTPFKYAQRQILHKMSGFFEPGTITAIMGPSGAGKTTLLNILTKQTRSGVRGSVLTNGQKPPRSYRGMIGYVRQDDVLLPHLTVYETLIFASFMKLPTWLSWAERKERINNVIYELGLEKCRNTIVGQPGLSRGVSGGERKRLSIGIELLLEPSVLLLDEPSSGLDSTIALALMETIHRLASGEKKRTVIITIHQPRSSIFYMLDNIMLLTEGHMVYYGPAKQVAPYFGSIGYPMPEHYNPADFMLDCVSRIARDTSKNKEQQELDAARIETIKEKYETECMPSQPQLNLPEEIRKHSLRKYRSYQSSWAIQTGTIFARTMTNQLRNTTLQVSRMFQVVVMAISVILVYGRLTMDASKIQDRIGLVFYILINQCLNAFFSSLNLLPSEISIFLRERSSKMYHVSAYFIGNSLADLVLQLIYPIVFGTITYWVCGLHPDFSRFLVFLLILVVSTVVAQSLAHALSTVTKSQTVASTLGPVVITGYLLFGGFYSNVGTMPIVSLPFYWTSLFHFGYEALMLTQFPGTKFVCDNPLGCSETTGEEVIKRLGFTSPVSNIWINLAFLVVLFIIAKLLGFLGLRFLQRPKAA